MLNKVKKIFFVSNPLFYLHILKIVPSVLGHRMILTYEASIDNFKAADVALKIAKSLV